MTTKTTDCCCPGIPSSPISVDAMDVVLISEPRRVKFTTATTFEFPATYNGSALPKETGPAIGMAMYHTDMWTTDLSKTLKQCRRGVVRKFSHMERINLLKAANIGAKEIASYCEEAIAIRSSRAESVRQHRREKRKAATTQDSSVFKRRQQLHPCTQD